MEANREFRKASSTRLVAAMHFSTIGHRSDNNVFVQISETLEGKVLAIGKNCEIVCEKFKDNTSTYGIFFQISQYGCTRLSKATKKEMEASSTMHTFAVCSVEYASFCIFGSSLSLCSMEVHHC